MAEPEASSEIPMSGDLALVMSGGGARAAYQVGMLRCVARHFPNLRVQILTGVSAGAINAAFLAARPEEWGERVERLTDLWSTLETEHVFRTGPLGLFTQIAGWGLSLLSAGKIVPRRKGMVDTTPLRAFLAQRLRAEEGALVGVDENLKQGRLRAVAITTSSYTTGQSITWVQGAELPQWERANRRSRPCTLRVDHVLASSALPLFFPAVRIDGAWYGDGGVRLTAPLSPAIHLGARRILAISTRYEASPEEADAPVVLGYPPPAQVAGVLLNAIFLDQFDGDALRLERINQLLAHLPAERRGGFFPIQLIEVSTTR